MTRRSKPIICINTTNFLGIRHTHTVDALVLVAQVIGLAPIGFNLNGGNTFGYIIEAALGIHTSANAIQIPEFVRSVGKVITMFPVLHKGRCSRSLSVHHGNLPTSDHPIRIVAAISDVVVNGIHIAEQRIVIRQLHFVIAIVPMQRVHIGDGELYCGLFRNCCSVSMFS